MARSSASPSAPARPLVAVHPWDIHGAHQAGMRTGWISRQDTPYPDYFSAPGLRAPDLGTLARQIVS
jgi:2-haloacid dehalogenase